MEEIVYYCLSGAENWCFLRCLIQENSVLPQHQKTIIFGKEYCYDYASDHLHIGVERTTNLIGTDPIQDHRRIRQRY